jgi:hypothetical protein
MSYFHDIGMLEGSHVRTTLHGGIGRLSSRLGGRGERYVAASPTVVGVVVVAAATVASDK